MFVIIYIAINVSIANIKKTIYNRCVEYNGGHSDSNCESCYFVVYGKYLND